MQTIPAKTIVSGYSEEGWFGSNYNMNIYKGCSHGCIYCDRLGLLYRMKDISAGIRRGYFEDRRIRWI